MTPSSEIAEKICDLIIHNWTPEGDDERLEALKSLVDQARKEAVEEYQKSQIVECKKSL